LPEIGKVVDSAMDAIEKNNPSLRNVLPKVYARGNLDPTNLGGLIDLVGNIALGDAKARSADVLGHVFEYFLGEFALAEGKKGGQFYTPRSVVELLVEMLEPYKGRVFDPCCGSGGMFVQSEKFVADHQGRVNDISIYGQESNQTTWRLAKMNLAIRGIDSSQVKWNNEGPFLNDSHKDLKADYVIANPPFNDSDWSGDLLRKDGRWKYGTPPTGNANYAWIQHFLYHLSPSGQTGFVLAKGALTSKTSGEGNIRKELIEARLVDCIVNLPAKLFLNTQIPASLWFLSRNKANGKFRNRTDEILFIDARNMGHLINRRTREFSVEDIATIAGTYHNWRNPDGDYEDVKGFCNSAAIKRVRELDYVLTPGRYVGLPDNEDDFDFNERFAKLKTEFNEQLKEETRLNAMITENLGRVKLP
jgi:type I restriction enzyme M protein